MYQFSLLSSSLLTFSLVQIIFLIILLKQDPVRGAKELGYVIFCISLYTVGTSFEYMGTSLKQVMFWAHLQYIGLSWLSLFLIHFTFVYFNITIKHKRIVYSLLIFLSLLFMLMQFTYNFHSLFYVDVTFNTLGKISYLSFKPKLFYSLMNVYHGLSIFLIYYFSVQMMSSHNSPYKRRGTILMFAVASPAIASIIYQLPIYEARIDFVPFFFIFSSMVLLYSYLRDSLFGPLPVAKRIIFESLSDGILILDKNDSLIDYNLKSTDFIPELKDAKMGESIKEFFAKVPCFDAFTNSNFYQSGTWDFTVEKDNSFGRNSYYEVKVAPIDKGNTQGTSLTISDVSERYEMQKALKSSYDQLVELNSLKTMLIEVMSHDLRSPLVTMKSLRRLMASGTIAKSPVIWKRSGDELDSLIDRADSLIFNLLAMSSSFDDIENHPLKVISLESVLVNLEDAILRYAKRKDVSFVKNIEDDVLIVGSSEYLRAIFRNILENSIKYSPIHGTVLLNVSIEKEDIVVSIEDEGDGIPDEMLETFQQDKWGITRMGTNGEGGPGIGLYATKRFIHALHGVMNIQRKKPMGTIVVFSLPRALGPLSGGIR